MTEINQNNDGTNHWDHFINTGSVRDYLDFKQMQTDKGANPYAGDSERNRNDFEDGAYRGF